MAKIGQWQILQLSVFIRSRNANTKATEYVTFSFPVSRLVLFPFWEESEPHGLSAIRILSVLAAIIRESSNKRLVMRIVKALPFIHQPDRVAPKASDVSAADWLYQHTTFVRARNPCITPQFM